MKKKRIIQSIDKSVDILSYISKNGNSVRLIDISNDLNINKSTLHGILSTLEYKGLISKDKNSSRYSLGIKLFEFGKIYEQDFSLKKITHPYIESLSKKFSETVHLAIESNFEVLYIDRIESPHSVRISSKVGNKDPLYCSAIGKTILSHMSNDNLEYYLDNYNLESKTQNTITDRSILKMELEKIKSQNYSVDKEELELGLICVASPIVNKDNLLIAIISISGPTSRITEEIFCNMTKATIETAKTISDVLSYKDI